MGDHRVLVLSSLGCDRAAIPFAGPLGYFCANRKLGLILYLAVWAVIFPIQTVMVLEPSEEAWYDTASYFVINAVILAAGIGLNALGARQRKAAPRRWRTRRRRRALTPGRGATTLRSE